jgi:hypothetical protein
MSSNRHYFSVALVSGLCVAGVMHLAARLLWLFGSPEQVGSTSEAVGIALVLPGLAIVTVFHPVFRAIGVERESIGTASIVVEFVLLWAVLYVAVHRWGENWRATLASRCRALAAAAAVVALAAFGVEGASEFLAPNVSLGQPLSWLLREVGERTGFPLASSALLVGALVVVIILGAALPAVLWLAARWQRSGKAPET